MEIAFATFKKSIRGTDEIMQDGWPQIAFIGRSNVGKSSLMNCILNRKDLVRAGKTPGKTREVNFFLVNLRYYFVDLPGYGYAHMSASEQEQLARMIQWYFGEQVAQRKTVLVLDMKVGPSVMDQTLFQVLRKKGEEVLVVANKVDSLNQRERSAQMKDIAEKLIGATIIPCSAKTKEGREEIVQWIFG